MLLKNRICIVTGGSSGIGRGIALEFAREGAYIAVADTQETPLQGKYHEKDVTSTTVREVEKLGAKGIYIKTDVSDENQVEQMIHRTVENFGGLDILVNNAGIHIPGSSQDITISEWDKVVSVNLRGVFITTKLAIPHLKKSDFGRIIQIASVHAFGGGAGPAYASAKAAVVNMVKDTALEVGKDRITVNAICPGYIETAIQDYLTPEQIESSLEKTPMQRLGLPRDIGRAAVFFASDEAEWITGTSLLVDGGASVKA
ncbi:MAG: glucose 1-dehydrogenase [Candidatus Poribacteria bacterium]|nr:glucose 1-dehydrogenase [Candidatus Poribacteria bacterium]